MFSNNRKAQTEILGLVIIVVLIAVGVLIAILVFSKPVGQELRYEEESLLAANFLNTLLKADANCKGRTIGEIIQACAELDIDFMGAIECEDGRNSCFVAKSLINEFLDDVFSERNMKFFFSVSGPVSLSSFSFGQSCKDEFESKTRPLIIFTGQTANVKLDICH